MSRLPAASNSRRRSGQVKAPACAWRLPRHLYMRSMASRTGAARVVPRWPARPMGDGYARDVAAHGRRCARCRHGVDEGGDGAGLGGHRCHFVLAAPGREQGEVGAQGALGVRGEYVVGGEHVHGSRAAGSGSGGATRGLAVLAHGVGGVRPGWHAAMMAGLAAGRVARRAGRRSPPPGPGHGVRSDRRVARVSLGVAQKSRTGRGVQANREAGARCRRQVAWQGFRPGVRDYR